VKPARFDYYDPTTLAEALSLLAQFGDTAKPLAGGQSLVPMMNMRLARPAQLVDLNRLGELNYLKIEQGELRIGAMTRQRVLERSEIVARGWLLLQEATRYIGHVALSRRHGYRFRLYLVRAYAQARGRRRKTSHRRPNARLYRKLHRAPWLLATSLAHEPGSARRVKHLYALRMQIEETFRDVKSHRWGFGLRYARSGSARRIEILVLLTALAALVLWLVGLAGRAGNLARHLQANTEHTRRVLSTPFVGRLLLLRGLAVFPRSRLDEMLLELRALVAQALPV
jgi:hypothetical protein